MHDQADYPPSEQHHSGPPPSAWFPDPMGRYEFRWFNGTAWTADVSIDGVRMIDPVALAAATPAGSASAGHIGQPPSGLAVLALVFGVVGIGLAWVPFLFVVGVASAIAALVLGIIARRRAKAGTGGAAGKALAGLVMVAPAFALAPIGFILTQTAIEQFDAYTNPGPTDVSVETCSLDGRLITIVGTIKNLDSVEHDYVVLMSIKDAGGDVATARIPIDGVAPRKTVQFETTNVINESTGKLRCDVVGVNGPFPFGLDAP